MIQASLPWRVASAEGLRAEDRVLVRRLVKAWQDHIDRNVTRHLYYVMHNKLVDLGISVPPNMKKLNAACGWGKKCVDVMVEHSKFDGFTVADEQAQAELDRITRANHLRTKYRRATTSALEQCFALWFVTRDEGGHARVSCYPASACGVTWDDANDQPEAAAFVVSTRSDDGDTPIVDWVNVVTDEHLIRCRLDVNRVWHAEYEPHGLGRLPVFVAAYETTLDRPLGTSRITREVMGYIDSALRANINEEVASAFASSTQKYLLGTDGDPFVSKSRWDTFIGSIFNIDYNARDGVMPQYGQLSQPSMQPIADHWRLLCGRMSAATGIHVSQFGQVHDNPSSSQAIYAENEPLILKVKDWNEDVSDTLVDVAIACLATERGVSFDEVDALGLGIEARFRNPSMPTLAQQTDSAVKIASVVDGFSETDTFWELNGFGKEERDRIRREMRQAQARKAIFSSFIRPEVSDGQQEAPDGERDDQAPGADALPAAAGRAGGEG